ncbi:MAG: 16S rRNA (adenine(1518)-N(6)/adenine(1519)-N(6))-dimethyltransferase RsmA, partial [Phycisphaerae bacterium]|nr:16S rRNA (adenine(1518)-N(6)/adenine(1519)-N(6))-dimethyltransferase RsmA [Phycisphaerae bacterium]
MAQSKQQILAALAAAGTRPKHRFGQNFMIDSNLVRLVAEAGRVGPEDVVLEVGPGTGTLTEELLSRGARVIAVEIDRDLAEALRRLFASEKRFELIEADVLSGKHQINPRVLDAIGGADSRHASVGSYIQNQPTPKLVANLPYNIASPLVIELLIAGLELLAFTVQKEVAERLKAAPGDEAYGALSVMAQLLGKVEVLRTLPPQAFWPAPKVESALVRITRFSEGGADHSQNPPHPPRGTLSPLRVGHRLPGVEPGTFSLPPSRAAAISRFVHAVFRFRRKMLKRALTE